MKKQLISAIKIFIKKQNIKSNEDLSFTRTGVTINQTSKFEVIGVNERGVEVLKKTRTKNGTHYSDVFNFERFSVKQLTRILIYLTLGHFEVIE